MDIKKLETVIKKPPLYEKGDSIMWTDKYISKQLLEIHINPKIDLASRTKQSIDKTIEFILQFCKGSKLNILDLGCGPGLYAERLAESGHNVTGVDFSETSIEYASNQARNKNLNIDYICKDYLSFDYKDKFDLVLLVYTDFGVLIPSEREKLLNIIHKALKSNGRFIFDVINEKNLAQKFQEKKSWTFQTKGFWRETPYLELTNGFNYLDEKVFLQQHIIIDQTETIKTYRFWTHFFSQNDIYKMLKTHNFVDIQFREDILPKGDIWNGDNVTFAMTSK